jgi:hypothetical protein
MEDYWNEISEFWPTIMEAWHKYKDKQPLIECNLLEHRVKAYPAKDYINTLSERTRQKTLQQYRQVMADGGMMVFIIDPERKVLQSYIFNANDIEPQRKPKKTAKRTSKKNVEFVLDNSNNQKGRRTSA